MMIDENNHDHNKAQKEYKERLGHDLKRRKNLDVSKRDMRRS